MRWVCWIPHPCSSLWSLSTLLPTEGFTPQWNSKQHHLTLLWEDGGGESDGQGDLPEISGEESWEAAGGLRRGLGHGRLPLPAEAERQLGGGEPDYQPFSCDEPFPGSAGPHFQGLHGSALPGTRLRLGINPVTEMWSQTRDIFVFK